ncbi:MAG: undecaprenyldiphospho-muramoylpentapeptide beta-N-acetylglucosaminyltransferase [Balneolaceae bacterium]|nr:undecaprenyldiphospho-muramoylpentapeptide beta-N-acetylglucosaminyltransferase [Balneolaceae bacterium]
MKKRAIRPESKSIRILIAAGGTGGHVYPAIAIADALNELDSTMLIKFAGTKTHMEWDAVPRAGYEIFSIWISGFHRRLTLKNLLFPVKLITSLVQSFKIISSFRPDAIISCGGYVAGPVGWVAAKRAIPLFIQEQNSFPGVTNRLLASDAQKIFTAFEDADRHFPKEKTMLAGNPTRKTLTEVNSHEAYAHFGFDPDMKTLLVLGGSGGAKTINEAMAENLEALHNDFSLQIIWQCGERYYDKLHTELNTDDFNHLRLIDFLHHMPEAYAVADVVISRAGALSCSELALTGNASILVPSPNVAGDHQTKNARSMKDGGAAEILKDEEVKNVLPTLVQNLIHDQERLKAMQQAALKIARPNAAKDIAQEILSTIKSTDE